MTILNGMAGSGLSDEAGDDHDTHDSMGKKANELALHQRHSVLCATTFIALSEFR